MTRDEAIAVLQEEIDGNLELTLREWRERDEQRLFPALRMAIEVLMHDMRTETHGVCSDIISRTDAIERIVNDNVVGGMDRINEYRNSNEHNDYLDGISTAIATVDDVPSADAEFADMPDIPRYYYEKVVGNMAHEISMLKEQLESAEAVQGEWIEKYYDADDREPSHYVCSECRNVWNKAFIPFTWHYCPNCGARMKGGAE